VYRDWGTCDELGEIPALSPIMYYVRRDATDVKCLCFSSKLYVCLLQNVIEFLHNYPELLCHVLIHDLSCRNVRLSSIVHICMNSPSWTEHFYELSTQRQPSIRPSSL